MAAPKNNKFALGNSGLSKRFQSAEDMQLAIDSYFNECDGNILKMDKYGNATKEPYTIEGLAEALGFKETDSLLNYEKEEGYEEFFGTIKKAKLKIQRNKVVNLLAGISNPAGSIFDLKNNHGYKDKQEIDQTLTSLQPLQFKIIGKD